MNKLPIARSEGIVDRQLGEEVLVYNLLTHKAHCLNRTASIVYRACDGKSSFEEIKRRHKFTDEIIFLALEELKRENLIQTDDSYVSPFAGMNRREVIRRVGLASMVALPVISSLVAPAAAMALSTTCPEGRMNPPGCACVNGSQCASECCGISGSGSRVCVAVSSKVAGSTCIRGCECIGGCCVGNICQPGNLPDGSLCTTDCECDSGDCPAATPQVCVS